MRNNNRKEGIKYLFEIMDRSKEKQKVKLMETKSRYEVIGELEEKKRSLIKERESFSDIIRNKKKEIKEMKRELEDAEEELLDYEESVEERKETIKELIASVDDSLKKMNELLSQKK